MENTRIRGGQEDSKDQKCLVNYQGGGPDANVNLLAKIKLELHTARH